MEKIKKAINFVVYDILVKGNLILSRSQISILAYYVVPIISILMMVGAYYTNNLNDLYRGFGGISLGLIGWILFIKPLSLIFDEFAIVRTISMYRRQLGINAFYFALFHFIGFLIINKVVYAQMIEIIKSDYRLSTGFFALVILLFMYFTSNNFSVKFMKKYWKYLQRLVYLAWFLILLHVALLERSFVEGYSIFMLIPLFILVKVLAKKGFKVRVLKYVDEVLK